MKEIILKVDGNDNVIGKIPKSIAHNGKGILHRAFLVIVFNNKNEILLAKRSNLKRLWPGFWDGTVASHQREGEDLEEAVRRRIKEEIGIRARRIKHLFKFYYQSSFKNKGSEREICHVFKIKTNKCYLHNPSSLFQNFVITFKIFF